MKIGFRVYERIKEVEELANKHGFKLGVDQFTSEENFALMPNGEDLPIFRRDATIMRGDLSQINCFLSGLAWAQNYDTALGLKTKERRAKAEKSYRNKELLKQIKNEIKNEKPKEDPPF